MCEIKKKIKTVCGSAKQLSEAISITIFKILFTFQYKNKLHARVRPIPGITSTTYS
jgi:hypothetical protein